MVVDASISSLISGMESALFQGCNTIYGDAGKIVDTREA
jgi:hypothetical protein